MSEVYQWDVFVTSNGAECVMCVAAKDEDEARKAALHRLNTGNVCWDGIPGDNYLIEGVICLGLDG